MRDTLRPYEDRATQDALAEARGEAPSTSREEAERMARGDEESSEEFKEEARQIGRNWRERQPAGFLAKHGLRH